MKPNIGQFIWTEESGPSDYDDYMYLFECYLLTNKIIHSDEKLIDGTSQSKRAVAALIVCGGPQMYSSIKAIADYQQLEYKAIRIGLDLEYKTGSEKQLLTRFNRCKPNENEKFYDYYKRLIVLARRAKRDDDNSLLAHISQWYPNEDLMRECMKSTATMKAVLEWAIAEDLNQRENKVDSIKSELNRVQTNSYRRPQNASYAQATRGSKTQMSRPRNNSEKQACGKCGLIHSYGECPAFGKQCSNCLTSNHYARMCTRPKVGTLNNNNRPTNKQIKPQQRQRQQRVSHTDELEDDDECFYITSNYRRIYDVNNVSEAKTTCPSIQIDVCNSSTSFIIDTGASLNLMSKQAYENIVSKPELKPCTRKLYGFNSLNRIPVVGQFETIITINSITKPITFVVVDNLDNIENLLGFKSLRDFNIVEIMCHINDFSACIRAKYMKLFENRIGKLIGAKVSIETNPEIRPSQQPHYQVPFHMIPGTKAKLQELIDQNIIESVPTDAQVTWISPMMPVEKGKAKIPKCKGI